MRNIAQIIFMSATDIKYMAMLFSLLLWLSPIQAHALTWNPSNGPAGGLVSTIAIDPTTTTTTTLYAGTSGGGIFKSTDGSGNWVAVNTGLTDTNVRAIAIDPITPTILYAGTNNGGVFKSTDGGSNWVTVNAGLVDSIVTTIVIDPASSNTLYWNILRWRTERS